MFKFPHGCETGFDWRKIGVNFLLFNFRSHPNIYCQTGNSDNGTGMFLESLIFESEISSHNSRWNRTEIDVSKLFYCWSFMQASFIIYWSNEVFFHSYPTFQTECIFSPVFESFFAFDFIGIVVLFIWFMFARTVIYVLGFYAFVVLDIFEQPEISINKRIKFHFTVIQNKFVELIENFCDHKNYHWTILWIETSRIYIYVYTRFRFFPSDFHLLFIEISILVKWWRQYETQTHKMYISKLFCGLTQFL